MSEAATEYNALVEQYAGGGRHLEQAVQHLSPEDLAAVPIPGKWSIRQVVIHLCDAELAFADRIKRLIAMDDPVLLAWNENAFAAKLLYDTRSVEDSVTLVRLIRGETALILRGQPDAVFARTGRHSVAGVMSLAEVVKKAVWHLEHHLKFIYEKREAMGKLMW